MYVEKGRFGVSTPESFERYGIVGRYVIRKDSLRFVSFRCGECMYVDLID